MGYLASIPILFLATVIQTGVFPQLRIYNGQPNLVLLVVISWAIYAELEEAIVWAIVGGILLDLMSITPLGTSSMGLTITVFMIYVVRQALYRINIFLIPFLVIGGTLIYILVVMTVLLITGRSFNVLDALPLMVIPTLIYNLLFIYPVYFVVRLIQRNLPGTATIGT